MEEQRKIEIVAHYGTLLSLVEVGLGSLLHTFQIPFAGIFLSLNQGYLLCRGALASKELPGALWTTYSISNIAAVLKSLSPSGQKLGPMLSLSMQGLLFNLGTALFGINFIGLSVGMILLSFWSFVQPLVTYYLFFGEELFKALEFTYNKTLPYHHLGTKELTWIFVGLIIVKAIVAIGLAIFAIRTNGRAIHQDKLVELALQKMKRPTQSEGQSAVKLAIKDLFRPIFLISLLMTTLFLFFSQHEKAQIGWYLLRPIAIGFICFYFSRTLTMDRWLIKMESGRLRVFALGCRAALNRIRKFI